jgi:hypothetical protein
MIADVNEEIEDVDDEEGEAKSDASIGRPAGA